jgi:esterase/lipase
MWSLAESQCRATPHLGRITQPALVVQSTGDQGCFISDAHAIHDQLGSSDKQLELVPGDHYLTRPESARDEVADLIVAWVGQRT